MIKRAATGANIKKIKICTKKENDISDRIRYSRRILNETNATVIFSVWHILDKNIKKQLKYGIVFIKILQKLKFPNDLILYSHSSLCICKQSSTFSLQFLEWQPCHSPIMVFCSFRGSNLGFFLCSTLRQVSFPIPYFKLF